MPTAIFTSFYGGFLQKDDPHLKRAGKSSDFLLEKIDSYRGNTNFEQRIQIIEATYNGNRQRFMILLENNGAEILYNGTDILASAILATGVESDFVDKQDITDISEIAYEIDFTCLEPYQIENPRADHLRIKNALFYDKVTITISLVQGGTEVFYTNGNPNEPQLIQHIGPVLITNSAGAFVNASGPALGAKREFAVAGTADFTGVDKYPRGEFRTWDQVKSEIDVDQSYFDVEWSMGPDKVIEKYLTAGTPARLRIYSGKHKTSDETRYVLVFIGPNGDEMYYRDPKDGKNKIIQHIGPEGAV